MQKFHAGVNQFGSRKVEKILDYTQGLDGLPKSNVLKYLLNSSVVVRPSGTEPKLKVYISVSAENKEAAGREEKGIADEVKGYMK